MTHDQHHPDNAQDCGSPIPLNIAALLRAKVDGELTDAQCQELRAYIDANPCAQSQMDFELALRGCCNRVMTKPCCPQALRDKVMSMAGQSQSVASASPAVQDDAYAQRIEASNQHTRSSSFWSKSPLMSAAAALLILVAGALIWQSASFTAAQAPSGLTIEQASYYDRVSDFVVREHNRCCDDTAASSKLINNDMNQAMVYFEQAFGQPLTMPTLDSANSQIEFFGGGDCHVPSTSRSGHLRFDAIDSAGSKIALSLFVSPDPGLLPMEEGVTYLLNAKACKDSGARLFAWVYGGIQYLLVSEASDDMCAKVRQMMKAPTNLSTI